MSYEVEVPSDQRRAFPFCWRKVTKRRTLLDNVYGYAPPGKMVI